MNLVDQNAVDGDGCLPVGPVLEAAQRRTGGPGPILVESGLQGQIVLQLIVVVEVFIALAQATDALTRVYMIPPTSFQTIA